jgi:hypothetical protein
MADRKLHHHFVAASYLRGFSNNDMLWGWFRELNEVRDVHIRYVAQEKGFYDLRLVDGGQSDDLENALAAFDGFIPSIISGAIAPTATEADVEKVRELFANTIARNHQGRDLRIPEATVARQRVEDMYDADFPDTDPAQRAWAIEYVMREVFDVPAHLAPTPETISRLNILTLASDILVAMPQHVCIFESDAQFFFTSDAPTSYFDSAEGHPTEGVTGPKSFSSPGLELTIPLDRKHAALIANAPLPPRGYANFGTVRVINARTAFFTKRVLLAYPSNDPRGELFVEEVMSLSEAYATPLLPMFLEGE